ncbi:hypothetical protein DFR49_2934 [Hephaestia caeni]|uniref:Uncharacterized protein n=1 Tax=Hephaestia caeni TaxID=645617 RepID=A0A397P546_9SPHN|nr:hypothetical protein [Hephaestia caeni]RIA44676.1 hypothetical protein DFR49_2934 [Hephaestia caeni]
MNAKAPSAGALAGWLIGITVLALIAIGPPGARKPAAPPTAIGPVASSVSVNDFTLTFDTIDMPIEEATYPDGPLVEVVNANCTSCHSPEHGTNPTRSFAQKVEGDRTENARRLSCAYCGQGRAVDRFISTCRASRPLGKLRFRYQLALAWKAAPSIHA